MIPNEILDRILEKPPGARRLVPVKEALRYGNFGLTKLYHLISDGEVVAYKDGRRTLVDLDSIDAYQRRPMPRLVAHRTRRRRRKAE
jgi:excisionase family DNA binding protein